MWLLYLIRAHQDAWAAHPELARAREQLCGVVALRVRDLQLLTDWPLVRAPRTPAQVAALMEEGEYGPAACVFCICIPGRCASASQQPLPLPQALHSAALGCPLFARAMAGTIRHKQTRSPSTVSEKSATILRWRPLEVGYAWMVCLEIVLTFLAVCYHPCAQLRSRRVMCMVRRGVR